MHNLNDEYYIRKMAEEIIKEINESIDGVERAAGEDNPYNLGYLDALYMVRDKIVKPIIKEQENR